MALKASPSSQHQHCTDEAQKAETVLSAVKGSRDKNAGNGVEMCTRRVVTEWLSDAAN